MAHGERTRVLVDRAISFHSNQFAAAAEVGDVVAHRWRVRNPPAFGEEKAVLSKRRSVNSVSRTGLALVAAAIVAIGSGADLGAEGQRGARDDRKFDKRLRERLTQGGSDEESEPVIVRLRRGSKHSVVSDLQAQGALVEGDHSIIEAVSVKLSRKAMRALAKRADVETISTDADVFADGIVSAVTGEALNEAYTLAKTVGLDVSNPNTPSGRNVVPYRVGRSQCVG